MRTDPVLDSSRRYHWSPEGVPGDVERARMVDDGFIAEWVERLRAGIPDAVAVLLKGSHARDVAGPHSDVDLDVLVAPGPRDDYRAWLVERGGRLVHVSVAVQELDGWLGEAAEHVSWAFGLPAHETTRLLWARDEALRARLDRPAQLHPPMEPELEDTVEGFGKVRNALRRGSLLADRHRAAVRTDRDEHEPTLDDLALRLAAQGMAQLCPSLLRPVNPDVSPTHRHEALLSALAFPVAPTGYRDDLLLCLGLSGRASTAREVHDAARRLLTGILALLREHPACLEGQLPPDLYGYLMDGTLERYVAQDGPA
jgi:phosphoribosyl-AMP cyclohydrolase